MRRKVVAVGIAGRRNRLDRVFLRDGSCYMTKRDFIRETNLDNLALEEQQANLLELEKDFEERKRPQRYERIKDGCKTILRPVKDGERVVVEAMRTEELKRLAGQKFTVYKGGRGSGVLAAHRVMIHAQQKQLDDIKETLKKRDAEIENLKYVIYLKDEQIEAQQTTPRLILEAKEKEIEQLEAALKNKLIPLTAQKMPWHLFEKNPPEPRQLIAMAEYSRISRRWTYWATKLERDQIAFWKQVGSDVRWAPLPELLVADEEPEVKA